MPQALVYLFLIALCLGCKNNRKKAPEDSVSNQVGGPFLTVADIEAPAQIDPLKRPVEEEINATVDFYLKDPKLTNLTCFQSKLEEMPIKAGNEEALVSGQFDINSCLESDTDHKYLEGRAEVFWKYTCKGVDLTELQGKTWSKWNESLCGASQVRTMILNLRTTSNLEVRLNDLMVVGSTVHVSGLSDSNANPCSITNVDEVIQFGDCVSYTKTLTTVATSLSSNYSRLDFKDLKAITFEDPFFKEGKMNFQFGDWKGEMNYSGPNTAPQWSAKRGNEESKGTFKGKQ